MIATALENTLQGYEIVREESITGLDRRFQESLVDVDNPPDDRNHVR